MEPLFSFVIGNPFYSLTGIVVATIAARVVRRKFKAETSVVERAWKARFAAERMAQDHLDRLDPDQWRRRADYTLAGLEPRI